MNLLAYVATVHTVAISRAIPSEYQAASLARQLFHRELSGQFVTVFPANDTELPGFPFASVEIHATDCPGTPNFTPGSLLIFISPLEINYKNFAQTNKISFAVHDTRHPDKDPLLFHRATALGTLSPLPTFPEEGYEPVATCFFNRHPDAREWEHSMSHGFRFFRLEPRVLEYIGGFGDSHYIGRIDVALYKQAPETAACSAWHGCSGTGNCCPYDDDNGFRPCCMQSSVVM